MSQWATTRPLPCFLCFLTACVPSLCPPERQDEGSSSEVSVRPEEVSSRKLWRRPEGVQGPEGLAVPESVPLSQKNQRETPLRLLFPLFFSCSPSVNVRSAYRNCETSWSVSVHRSLLSIQIGTGSSWGGQLPSGYTGLRFHQCPCAKKKAQTVHVALIPLAKQSSLSLNTRAEGRLERRLEINKV